MSAIFLEDLAEKVRRGIEGKVLAGLSGGGRVYGYRPGTGVHGLPTPLPESGDVALLKRFVNAGSEDDFRLMVAWLPGCLRPEGPYPLLILSGEQGSAKSTTSRVLRSLVDPSTLATRSLPQDEHNLIIAARGTHVLAFDNISRIKGSMADALCRLATGGGLATRKLHSDSDEILFDATRPSLLNGIPDLAERAITLTLPRTAAPLKESSGTSSKRRDPASWRGYSTRRAAPWRGTAA